MAEVKVTTAELVSEKELWNVLSPSGPEYIILENHTAVGGANAAIALGIWTLIGAFLTQWSFINGLLGLVLGSWGLMSPKVGRAYIGIGVCLAGIIFCTVDIRGFIAGERSTPEIVPIQNPDESFDGTDDGTN